MSAVVAKPEEVLRGQLVAMAPQLAEALPPYIKPERFSRVVMTVVQQQPELLAADRRSLLIACTKCASDGLVPDGREAAFVIFNKKIKQDGRDLWIKVVQYLPMVGGVLKRIHNSGEVASVQAHVIRENDEFVIRRGLNETVVHTPKFPGNRGKIIGAYAIAKFKDGRDPIFEAMDLDDINRVREVSRSKNDGPWVTWFDRMACKAVLHRLSRYLPMDSEVARVFNRDDEASTIENVPLPEHGQQQAPSARLDAIEAGLAVPAIAHDPDTGEILEDDVYLPPIEADEAMDDPVQDAEATTAATEGQGDRAARTEGANPPTGADDTDHLRDRVDAAIQAVAAAATPEALARAERKIRPLLGDLDGHDGLKAMVVDSLAAASGRVTPPSEEKIAE